MGVLTTCVGCNQPFLFCSYAQRTGHEIWYASADITLSPNIAASDLLCYPRNLKNIADFYLCSIQF